MNENAYELETPYMASESEALVLLVDRDVI